MPQENIKTRVLPTENKLGKEKYSVFNFKSTSIRIRRLSDDDSKLEISYDSKEEKYINEADLYYWSKLKAHLITKILYPDIGDESLNKKFIYAHSKAIRNI